MLLKLKGPHLELRSFCDECEIITQLQKESNSYLLSPAPVAGGGVGRAHVGTQRVIVFPSIASATHTPHWPDAQDASLCCLCPRCAPSRYRFSGARPTAPAAAATTISAGADTGETPSRILPRAYRGRAARAFLLSRQGPVRGFRTDVPLNKLTRDCECEMTAPTHSGRRAIMPTAASSQLQRAVTLHLLSAAGSPKSLASLFPGPITELKLNTEATRLWFTAPLKRAAKSDGPSHQRPVYFKSGLLSFQILKQRNPLEVKCNPFVPGKQWERTNPKSRVSRVLRTGIFCLRLKRGHCDDLGFDRQFDTQGKMSCIVFNVPERCLRYRVPLPEGLPPPLSGRGTPAPPPSSSRPYRTSALSPPNRSTLPTPLLPDGNWFCFNEFRISLRPHRGFRVVCDLLTRRSWSMAANKFGNRALSHQFGIHMSHTLACRSERQLQQIHRTAWHCSGNWTSLLKFFLFDMLQIHWGGFSLSIWWQPCALHENRCIDWMAQVQYYLGLHGHVSRKDTKFTTSAHMDFRRQYQVALRA